MNRSIDWPLDRNIIRRGKINHTFGWVRRNSDGSKRPHQGWDFEAAAGTDCFAIADGVVDRTRFTRAYGKQIILKFAVDFDGDGDLENMYAVYCHMASYAVKTGDPVNRGQLIGKTGNTGNAQNMSGLDEHLHFEIRERPITGRGLTGRYSPMTVFEHCPLREAVMREGLRHAG